MADPITWGLINGVKKGVKTVQSTLDGLLDDIKDEFGIFIDDAEEVIEKLGTGLPPRDLAAFSSQSTEDGIKLTFTPPAQTYIDDGGTNQFAVMPAGVLIRYSDTGYPRTPDEGKFGYDYKPTGDWVTTSQECTIVGLTKDTKYYFTAFPYSTEHVYNKNQVTANRTEMTWVGNKGTISVTVQTPEGYEGTLGEYTITLVDQASASPQNVEKTATGAGLTRFGGLTAGKSYKVRLSSTADLQAPPDSEVITIVGGVNYDVTMTYALMYGTITVNVSTQPAGMPIGAYTVTLTPQGGGDAMQQSGNNSQAVVFSNVKNGVVYTVGLSAINHYTANAGGTVAAVGGQNISHNAHYAFSAQMNDLSWAEISQLNRAGVAKSVFSIGDRKTISAKKLDFKYSNGDEEGQNEYTQENVTTDAILIDFDKDGTGVMTFFCDEILAIIPVHCYGGWIRKHQDYAADQDRIDNNIENFFSSDLCSVLVAVSKSTSDMPVSTPSIDRPITPATASRSCKVFAPSATELGFSNKVKVSEYPTSPYSYFSSSQNRSINVEYASRSLQTNENSAGSWGRCAVDSSGSYFYRESASRISYEFSYPLAFCIK